MACKIKYQDQLFDSTEQLVNYLKTSNSFKASKNIDSFVSQQDLIDYATDNKTKVVVDDRYKNELIASITENVLKSKVYTGHGMDVKFDGLTDKQIKAKIENEIVPEILNKKNSIKNLGNWIIEGMTSAPESYFGTNKMPYSQAVISQLKLHLNLDKHDKIVPIKDYLKDKYLSIFPENTYIIESPDKSISIIELTSDGLMTNNSKGKYLFHKNVSGRKQSRYNLNLNNNTGGVKHLTNGLLMAYLKSMNPEIQFGFTRIVNPTSSNAGIQTVEMQRVINYMTMLKDDPSLKNMFPKEIQELLNNESLFDETQYRADFLSEVLDLFQENKNVDGITYVTTERLQTLKTTGKGQAELVQALKDWMRRHRENNKSGPDFLSKDKKYYYASLLLKQLTDVKTDRTNTVGNLESKVKLFINMSNIKSDTFQWVKDKFDQAHRKVSDNILDFNKKNKEYENKMVDAYRKHHRLSYLAERVGDWRPKFYESLFKTVDAEHTDSKGNVTTKKVKLREIHWDKNNKETKRLIESGKILPEQIEYANWYLDQQKEVLIKFYSNNLLKRFSGKYYQGGEFKENLLLKDAEEEYKRNVPDRGVVLAISKTTLQSWSTANDLGGLGRGIKESVTKAWKDATQPNKLFAEEFGEVEYDKFEEVADRFAFQFNGDRLMQTGLRADEGKYVVEDLQQSDDLNTDLSMMIELFNRNTVRKIIYENEVLPVLNSAMVLIEAEKVVYGTSEASEKNKKEITEKFVERVVHGKTHNDLGKVNIPLIGEVDLGTPLAVSKKIASHSSVALSPFVGMSSLLIGQTKLATYALANSVSGSEFFGIKEATAAGVVITNILTQKVNDNSRKQAELIGALVERYGITNMDEHEITDHKLYQGNKKTMLQSHYLHWMNWGGDYMTRVQVMVAQMMKDGTWEGYSLDKDGKLVYNEKKDKRYYDDNGKLTKEGTIIRENKIQDMITQGIQTETDKMTRAYDRLEEKRLKAIADRYIMGAVSKSEGTTAESYSSLSAIMQFRRFLPMAYADKFDKGHYVKDLGKRVVVTNAMGKSEVIWQNRIAEGTLQSFGMLVKDMTDFSKKNGLRGWRGKENWDKMPDYRKENFSRLLMEALVFASLYILSDLVFDFDDDEEDENGKKNKKPKPITFEDKFWNKMGKTFHYTVMDLIFVVSPRNAMDLVINPSPGLTRLEDLSEIIFDQKVSNLPKLLPGGTTFELMIDKNKPKDEETNE